MNPMLKQFIAVCSLISILVAQSPERKNMAIYNFSGLGVSPIEAQVISDRLRSEISKFDTYSIIERGLMEQILEEQVLQLSGLCDDASCLVEVGQILAVHYMVGGSVSKIGNLFTIEARIIDVESGKVVNSVVEDYNGPIENLLVQTTKIVAAKLSGNSTNGSSLVLTGNCDIFIQSNPPGGTIYINDRPMGDVTPYRLEGLQAGDYKIKVRKGNLIGEAITSLERNDRKDLTVNLAEEQFILRIYTEPEGAEVSINQGRFMKTPYDYIVTDTTLNYQIQLRKDLYFDFNETVHFSDNAMLRLSYELVRCGRIEIPYQKDVKVYLNDKPIAQLHHVDVIGSAFTQDKRWIIDQLEITDYQLRVEKVYHQTYEQDVSLSSRRPVHKIKYNLSLMNANVTFKSEVEGSGLLSGIKDRGFRLNPGQITNIMVPYGNYTLSAHASGYLPFKKELTLFNQDSDPVTINFQRPDKQLALKRSLLFPGMGQIYSQQLRKGILLGVLTSVGVGWLINSISQYGTELDTYNELSDNYAGAITIEAMDRYRSQLNTSQDQLTSYRNQFLAATSLALVSYSWSIFDITVLYPYE